MTSETEVELEDALQVEDSAESVRRVKDIVSAALLVADPSVRVTRTEYFNHTYVPDLVVEWPSRGVDCLRRVYLRATQDPEQIEIDVKMHESSSSVFVHLSALLPTPGVAVAGLADLSDTAKSTQSLVTQVGSFEQLAKYSLAPGARLLPPSVLRGGCGLLEADHAAATAQTVSRGFAGAIEADRETTQSALEAIESVLAPAAATEVTSVLETMWVASGAPIHSFPRRNDRDWNDRYWDDPHLSPDRLRSLLRAVPPGLSDFWQKVGHRITLESFDGLNIVGEDRTALQSIMQSALRNITARTCRIVDLQRTEKDSGDLIWRVEHGQLSLQGFGHRSWIGQRSDDFPTPDKSVDRRPSPQKLANKSLRSGIPITSVSLIGGGRTLSYGSQEGVDIIGDDFAAPFAENLGSGAVVERAVALVESSKPVTIDFSTGTAFGRPSARLEAPRLLWTTWTMLGELDSSEWASFTRVVRPKERALGEDEFLDIRTPRRAISGPGPVEAVTTRLRSLRHQLADAETEYRSAARSGDLYAMLLLGMLLEHKGELTEAEIWFRSAIDPGKGEAMVALGSLLEEQGEIAEAVKWYRLAAKVVEP
ncbi:hypothetical protein FOH10_18915 [Nocardia otitidiscaviarum]|uniref:Tetratricopeptide repeat protein n=1 Tax=Nocardia otitidiscaviarum TaxID=1823 RepID=A0A516NNJ9_9NOCA|nr:tetratricopeptide repeat protein [Nocardia otitidiscaviarum]MCP9624291.1 tetratricopeptide repeat protein [Nocardia otitidiscaviarum]QDP80474.1 hypothetical protein FOH10_18915 [Nocardia otitidiscaviarum]